MIVNFFLSLAVLAALLGIVYLYFFKRKKKKKGPMIADTPSVVVAINKIAELATACYFGEKIILKRKNFLLGDELCIIAKGLVRAGYNLKELKPGDVSIKKDVVTVRLPKVEILDVIINPSDWDFYVEDGNWNDEIRDIKAEAKKDFMKDAIEHGILEKAKRNGERKITALLLSLGFKGVVFS